MRGVVENLNCGANRAQKKGEDLPKNWIHLVNEFIQAIAEMNVFLHLNTIAEVDITVGLLERHYQSYAPTAPYSTLV